jgi:hypothetical protein
MLGIPKNVQLPLACVPVRAHALENIRTAQYRIRRNVDTGICPRHDFAIHPYVIG